VLSATILEASGDAVIRLSLHNNSLAGRVLLLLLGSVLLALYGTSLNLAPVDFAAVTGLYVATLIVAFQVANYVFFHTTPTPAVMVGGGLIVAGGLIIYLWK
jgi:small multidrug resistance family-3 protein